MCTKLLKPAARMASIAIEARRPVPQYKTISLVGSMPAKAVRASVTMVAWGTLRAVETCPAANSSAVRTSSTTSGADDDSCNRPRRACGVTAATLAKISLTRCRSAEGAVDDVGEAGVAVDDPAGVWGTLTSLLMS